jgi:hypothetical protein
MFSPHTVVIFIINMYNMLTLLSQHSNMSEYLAINEMLVFSNLSFHFCWLLLSFVSFVLFEMSFVLFFYSLVIDAETIEISNLKTFFSSNIVSKLYNFFYTLLELLPQILILFSFSSNYFLISCDFFFDSYKKYLCIFPYFLLLLTYFLFSIYYKA